MEKHPRHRRPGPGGEGQSCRIGMGERWGQREAVPGARSPQTARDFFREQL